MPLDTNPLSEIPVSGAPAHFQPQTDPSASWAANAAALSATRPSPNQRCHALLTQSRREKKLRLKEPNKTTTHRQQGYNSSSRVSSPSWAKALLHPRSPEGSGSQLPGKEIPGALPDSSLFAYEESTEPWNQCFSEIQTASVSPNRRTPPALASCSLHTAAWHRRVLQPRLPPSRSPCLPAQSTL